MRGQWTIFYLVCLGLLGMVAGLSLGAFLFHIHWVVWLWLMVGLLSIALVFYKRSGLVVIIALFLVAISSGILRFNLYSQIENSDISFYNAGEITLRGVIIDDPKAASELSKFTVRVDEVIESSQPVSGKLLITTRKYPGYQYGNEIEVSGRLKLTDNTTSYAKYLSRFGIYATIDYPGIKVISEFKASTFLSALYHFKNRCINIIERGIPQPAAAFLAGLLFGDSSSMPKSVLEDFNRTGLTHIVALSGFNITLIAGVLLNWLRFLPLRFRFSFAVLGIIAFVLMTGASPSVVRAAVMAGVLMLSGVVGRSPNVTVALLFAATVMAWFNPKIIIYDIGFQLSFLSTVGILYLSPMLGSFLSKRFWWVNEYLGTTLSALIMAFPIIAYNFQQVSLIAPIANLLVLPLIPLTMSLGFLALVAGAINLTLGWMVGIMVWAPLAIAIFITQTLSRLPLASLELAKINWGWPIAYYLVLLIFVIYKKHVRSEKVNSLAGSHT
ncbi:competence protein ComEC family protein [Patescibacteria group bacterium]|nr:competence protein ComEC family protein [Patescibacteria group bacterium]